MYKLLHLNLPEHFNQIQIQICLIQYEYYATNWKKNEKFIWKGNKFTWKDKDDKKYKWMVMTAIHLMYSCDLLMSYLNLD